MDDMMGEVYSHASGIRITISATWSMDVVTLVGDGDDGRVPGLYLA